MIRFRSAQKPPIAMPFSPTRSRLDAPPSSRMDTTPEAVAACLAQDSGFAGMTLGEGLHQYHTLVRCKGSDVAWVMAYPLLTAYVLLEETIQLPFWLFPDVREGLKEEEDRHYPYEKFKALIVGPKHLLINKLIPTDDLYQRIKNHLPKSNVQDCSREAFTGMVKQWAALGWVKTLPMAPDGCLMVPDKCLFITGKGLRVLKQYRQTPHRAG